MQVIAYSYGVSVPKERLNLLLIMDVPNSEHSIFAARDEVLAIRRNSTTENFIEVTLMRSVELFSSEEQLLLTFKIPYSTQMIKINAYTG